MLKKTVNFPLGYTPSLDRLFITLLIVIEVIFLTNNSFGNQSRSEVLRTGTMDDFSVTISDIASNGFRVSLNKLTNYNQVSNYLKVVLPAGFKYGGHSGISLYPTVSSDERTLIWPVNLSSASIFILYKQPLSVKCGTSLTVSAEVYSTENGITKSSRDFKDYSFSDPPRLTVTADTATKCPGKEIILVPGSAISFNGNGYIPTSYCHKTKEITVEFWMKANADQLETIFLAGGSTDMINCYFKGSDRTLNWYYGDPANNGGIKCDYTPYVGKWTHVALVSKGRGGNYKAIYLDGKKIVSDVYSNGPVSPSVCNLVFGKNPNGNNFRGMIDEFRIWDRVLTETELQKMMNDEILPSTPGMLACWRFDERIAPYGLDTPAYVTDVVSNKRSDIFNVTFDDPTYYSGGYVWSPGTNLNQMYFTNPSVNTTYTVTATAANGCKSSASVNVKVGDCTQPDLKVFPIETVGCQSVIIHTWETQTGVTVINNIIRKTAPDGWGNAGTSSKSIYLYDGQYIETTGGDLYGIRSFGLSSADNPESNNSDAIQYGFVLNNNAAAIKVPGQTFNSFNISSNDKLRIMVKKDRVEFYLNKTLKYTELSVPKQVIPGSPLKVVTALFTSNATMQPVYEYYSVPKITLEVSPYILYFATNYEWVLNDGYAESSYQTFTSPWFRNGDIISCKYIPQIGTMYSNKYVIKIPVCGYRVSDSIGNNENQKFQANIFPNPASGAFTINMEGFEEEQVLLEISDPDGKPVLESKLMRNELTIDPGQDFKPGIYTVKVSGKNGSVVEKLMIIK
jgi:hypothetical protein